MDSEGKFKINKLHFLLLTKADSDVASQSYESEREYNEKRTGYEYAVIIDPIYSRPVLISSCSLNDEIIIKEGQIIESSDVKSDDLVYKISDIWDVNNYFLVIDSKVNGKIISYLPNELSPRSIKIIVDKKEVTYELSEFLDFDTLSNYKVGDLITLILGYDEKVCFIFKSDVVCAEI